MKKTSPNDKDTVFHYCPTDAFIKIIKTGKIWLSRYDFLNDYHECSMWDDVLREFFFKKIGDGNDILGCYSKEVISEASKVTNWIMPYIACFSHSPDRLSQWRGYGDDGKGFAIGFNKSLIKRNTEEIENKYHNNHLKTDNDFHFYAEKIKYKEKPISHALVFEEFEEMYKDCENMLDFMCRIIPLQSFSKQASFFEEEEYRIVLVTKLINQKHDRNFPEELSEICFRSAQSGAIIPYYALTMPPPSRIVIGPKNPLTEKQLEFMLPRICEWDKHESYFFDCEKSDLTYK